MSNELQSGEKLTVQDGVLLCPRCGGNNLHHCMIVIFARDGEDRDGTVITVDKTEGDPWTLATERRGSGDFPGRRGSVEIDFSCETCGDHDALTLLVRQHKGETLMRWKE